MLSRSLLLAQSSPVVGWNASPTELRRPVANVCGLESSRLYRVTAARGGASLQTLQDEPTATYSRLSGPNAMVRVLCPPLGRPDTSVTRAAAPGSSRFTVVCSAKYIVSRRNARPNGPLRPLSTVWAGASATPSPFASTSRTIVPAPVSAANTAPPGPSASERTPPSPSAKRLTLKPLWTYSARPAIRTVSWPAGGDELCAPGSAPQASSASAISICRGAIRSPPRQSLPRAAPDVRPATAHAS